MPAETIQGISGGTIRPSRFVKISTAADQTFLEADANEQTIGIAQDWQRDAPIDGADVDAAEAGDPLSVNPIGCTCLLQIGSGGVTAGDEIKSDADGKGVTRATTGTTVQNVGAIALETAVEDELARVFVYRTSIRPALT